ncbi:sulfatase-like hydrolase/transferase [Halostella salina]|uniref:sulfatase-like hydrolase/transferase n=1 Tax=Halostella salina TaxID=1547897 RepID=UPI0013CEC2B7|nr:sulfatase-like hydrolase/transferase [Halostella salina]
MNVLLLSIDSLRRDFLTAYRDDPRCLDHAVETDNIDRFAERAATFETHYAGSLPCMPARREWLTGTREFLWRPWGPTEAFDETIPELARREGVLTHLITDHYHYFQHGSGGYYEDFNGFDFLRGHEYDAWRTAPREPDDRLVAQSLDREIDDLRDVGYVNRAAYPRNAAALGLDDPDADESEFFGPRVLSRTAEWLGDHGDWDDWFCYVDSFDVHEPFHCPEPYASMYTDEDPTDPELPFWPYYGPVDEGQSELSERELEFVRAQFAGKVTMVDRWFGRVLDALDDGDLWNETMVVVTSDHGFFLGDHGWVGKNEPPCYDVLARTPLFVWHPESERNGDRIESLTSAVDIYPTVLDALDAPVPDGTHGRTLRPLLAGDADEGRDSALYGYWGSAVNVTDGRHTYLHPCDPSVDADCFSTGMLNARGFPLPRDPKTDADAGQFLPYTDSPVWRYAAPSFSQTDEPLLFDTREDPGQTTNLADDGGGPAAVDRMRGLLVDALDDLGAPDSQYARLGLD